MRSIPHSQPDLSAEYLNTLFLFLSHLFLSFSFLFFLFVLDDRTYHFQAEDDQDCQM